MMKTHRYYTGLILSAGVLGGLVQGAVAQARPKEPIPGRLATERTSSETADAIKITERGALGARAAFGGTIFEGTGADNCNDVTVIPLSAGPPGSPTSITILGDNTPATGPDCASDDTQWWEAFELAECASVTIDFCGTSPAHVPSNAFVYPTCPASGTNCGALTFRSEFSNSFCGDGNRWIGFENLEPGIYYYAVSANDDTLQNGRGPYEMHITAQICTGSCCDFTVGTCTDDVSEADCSGADQLFDFGGSCCFAECLPPGETYASSGVELLSHVPIGALGFGTNDAWGYVSPSGREYAIAGVLNGTVFVEITNPFQPVVIAQFEYFFSFWTDMKVFGEYAYSVNESGGGMQIINLTQIDDGIVTLDGALTASGFSTAHNLALNTDSGYAYLCGSNINGGGLTAVDVSDPANPTIAGAWTETGVHDALIISYDDGPHAGREIAFVFGGPPGFWVVDVTDKANMFTAATLPNLSLGFAHQGWITEDRKYVIFGDEGGNSETTTYVVNVEDVDAPFFVNTYTSGKCSIDHNVMIQGPLAYHANYTSGLHVVDVSDPPNAQPVAFFDTHPESNAHAFAGIWGIFAGFPSGVVVVMDMQRGLFVLNYDCNRNGIDDTEEIAATPSMDGNCNGLPDECEAISVPAAPLPEPDAIVKSRYISFVVPEGKTAAETALRVELSQLHHVCSDGSFNLFAPCVDDADCIDGVCETRFGDAEGQYRYVNAIKLCTAGTSIGIAPCQSNADCDDALGETCEPMRSCQGGSEDGMFLCVEQAGCDARGLGGTCLSSLRCEDSETKATTFLCAVLGCQPEYRDWAAETAGGTLHVTGAAVVPGRSSYAVSQLSAACAGCQADCSFSSSELFVTTAQWGDVDPGALNAQDLTVIVDRLKDLPEIDVIKPRAQLTPNIPSPVRKMNVNDLEVAVDALKSFPFAFPGPGICP